MIKSLKDIIQEKCASSYEAMLMESVNKAHSKALLELDTEFAKIRKEVKNQAARFTVELMQKMDTNGVTLEVKF